MSDNGPQPTDDGRLTESLRRAKEAVTKTERATRLLLGLPEEPSVLTMGEYQDAALRTWNPNGGDDRSDLAYLALGLIGESGEVAEQIKKHFRHGHALDVTHLEEELGDVLWYVAVLADALGLNLDQVAGNNVDKLERRYPEGFSEKRSRERAVISETLGEL